MDETIHGTVMPVLELSLQPGESIISEVGEFSWMTDAMTFSTGAGGGMGGKGIMGAMKRAVQSAMRLGAEGIRINCAGRLGGAEIARTE